MKNLYTLTFLIAFLGGHITFGQSSTVYNPDGGQPEPTHINRGRIIPFIGFSVAIPLIKRSNRDKQQQKILRISVAPLLTPLPTEGMLAKPVDPKQDDPDRPIVKLVIPQTIP